MSTQAITHIEVERDFRIAIDSLPLTFNSVATLQREAENDAPVYANLPVTCHDEYVFADALLTDVVRRKDDVVAMRKSATVPLYQVIRTIEGWFKPVVTALESSERALKSSMGAWRLAQADRERAAREAAAAAADANDAGAMLEALVEASTVNAAPADARATVRYVWAIKRINEDMMTREWLVPDVPRIAKLARETPGDGDPPVVPGVVFERVAQIGARR